MAAKDCPRCGLGNPPEALRCDCGWDFVSKTLEESYLGPKDRLRAGALGVFGFILVMILLRLIMGVLFGR
ncbi:MAG: hypothetical protein ACRC33_13750 [Gemmataceae bacterium]